MLDHIPTKKEAAHFGSVRWVEDSCKMMTCTPDDVAGYAMGTVSETVGDDIHWLGSHGAAKKHWVDRYYGEYFGESRGGLI